MSQHFYDPQTGELVPPGTKGAYPSPSTILDRLRSYEYEALVARMGQDAADDLMDTKANRGTRVHKAIEDINKGWDMVAVLDELGDDPDAQFLLIGYINWLNDYEPIIKHSELTVVSHKYKYAGTLDLVVEIDGKLWIIDIKTGMDMTKHGLQLKYYWQGYLEGWLTKTRMGVLALDLTRACGYRHSKQPYGLKEYKEPWSACKAHLDVFKWWQKKEPIRDRPEPTGNAWSPDKSIFKKEWGKVTIGMV